MWNAEVAPQLVVDVVIAVTVISAAAHDAEELRCSCSSRSCLVVYERVCVWRECVCEIMQEEGGRQRKQ
jgi:hypothetical protein